jgi:SpoVK/Ycf46/Vps4 family AAA+-type ATPase
LLEYLATPGANSLYERYLKPVTRSDYLLESFPIRENERALCRALLGGKAPVQLLLHGSEGTGKTEFAKALVLDSGKLPYILDRSEGDRSNNLVRLTMAQAALPAEKSVIIVDEADGMLDGGRLWFADLMLGDKEEKARINTFLDQARCPVIWIVNSIDGVQPSTKRRFAFSVEFKPLKPGILADRVVVALEHINISDRVKKYAAEMASSRKLTGAAITNLCTTLEELAKSKVEEDTMVDYVSVLFSANSTLVSGKLPKENKIDSAYDVGILNVSMETRRIIGAVNHALEKPAGTAGCREERSSLRILFHGLPGTGKTEFARFIARESGRKLDIRRSSDILSPYVGIAEKNIASMFNDAEESGNILLIDEADAFLYNRGKARRSWEITQVDEFLTQMEDYRGVLICTTNMLDSMDQAVIRRFQIKTEFLPLDRAGTEKLLAGFFPSISFDFDLLQLLAIHGPYVPGDFNVVKGLCTTLLEDEITPEFVIDALIGESRHRQKREKQIGFNT